MDSFSNLTRRDFVKTTLTAGAAISALSVPFVHAQSTTPMKVALIGCGGRGSGALANHLEAAGHLGINMKVVGVADVFKDSAVGVGRNHGLEEDLCFDGFEGYKQLLDTDPDIVLMATSPNFRPLHFAASIEAGKHVFMEKPVAVDPPGARHIMETGKLADEKGLKVVAGTQRRHSSSYQGQAQAFAEGKAGRILGGTVSWCGGQLWYKNREPGESDASYMIRNWVSFAETSGDHIVEQHVHNIDIANWFIGRPPLAAIGFGGRARRITGNQFDFFSVDYNYGEGVNIHSMCRQINGCYNRVGEGFRTDLATVFGGGRIRLDSGGDLTLAEFPEFGGPYVQEHVNLLSAIVNDEPMNDTQAVADSTLSAIMGRIAAYTGQMIRWTDLTENQNSPYYDLTLTPAAVDFEKGPVTAPTDEIAPIPGRA